MLLDYADEIATPPKFKKKRLTDAALRAAIRRDLYWRLAFAFVGFCLLAIYELDRQCRENLPTACPPFETFIVE